MVTWVTPEMSGVQTKAEGAAQKLCTLIYKAVFHGRGVIDSHTTIHAPRNSTIKQMMVAAWFLTVEWEVAGKKLGGTWNDLCGDGLELETARIHVQLHKDTGGNIQKHLQIHVYTHFQYIYVDSLTVSAESAWGWTPEQ